MSRTAPDQLLLSWLCELPQRHRDDLVRRYIFMTCVDSADLVLNGEEAWRHFRKQLLEPDFPLRRVARVLSARALLAFLIDCLSSDEREAAMVAGSHAALPSLDAAQFQRAGQRLYELCQNDLSDDALQDWLLTLQGI